MKDLKFFNKFNEDEIGYIFENSEKRILKKNELLFKEGDKGEHLFVLLSGAIRISTMIEGVGEENLAVFRAGEVFGENAIIDNGLRSATAISHEDSELLFISRQFFMNLMDNRKEIAVKILRGFIENFNSRFYNSCESLKNFYLMDKMFH